jgi:uncharacterized protein YbjT (DUF2867 family)
LTVFLTGATGFIGGRIALALLRAGHAVVVAARDPSAISPALAVRAIAADFTTDHDPATWLPRLAGVDVIVNAVGILRERGRQTFAALHRDAPKALFAAAAQAGVRRIVQISALGADTQATSAYHRSKKAADDALVELGIAATIVQPSLVYGRGGASARLFNLLAAMPITPLPGHGEQRIQPVHIDDVVDAIVRLVEGRGQAERLPLVGPEPLTLRVFLARLRSTIGLGRISFLPVPMPLVRAAARAGDRLQSAMLDRDTLAMLERGNTADARATRQLLEREPRPVSAFVRPDEAGDVRTEALLAWLLPVLRVSIAAVWIATGIVSLGVYPVEQSYALLARVGVTGSLAPTMLYGAALLDIALGVATLALARRRALWLAQIALIVGYTALISWRLPEFWLHPYGPILKNLPMLAALWLLYELEGRDRRRG